MERFHIQCWRGYRTISFITGINLLCQKSTDSKVKVRPVSDSPKVDVPIYVSDCSRVQNDFGWFAKKSVVDTVEETTKWILDSKIPFRMPDIYVKTRLRIGP